MTLIQPEKDAFEQWDSELYAEAARVVTADLRITYVDADGQRTHRNVTVERYARTDDRGGGVMIAFCHLRQARRPFRFSRIAHAADMETAQTVTDLGAFLDARYVATPLGRCDAFVSEHAPALGALLFVAKADDALRAKEKDVMRNFCAECGLADAAVCDLVVELVATWPAPSKAQYGADLRAIGARDMAYRELVRRAALAIVATDKTVRENETRALERLQRELGIS